IESCLEGNVAETTITGAPATFLYDHDSPRLLLTPTSFAYVKIAEGCDHRCTFCAIPAIRGPQRSRDIDSVRIECERLVDSGIREINLIAQDTTRYGADRTDGATITELLKTCDQIPGTYWLRLLYTHPRYVTEDLLATMAQAEHILPYIDIPLQHINDTMLQRMGRRVSNEETIRLMEAIRSTCPGITIRTTFLVGFPGETDAMHRELMAFVESFRFDRLGVFTYSPEPGTPALNLDLPPVPQETADARREELLELQQGISQAHNDVLLGETLDVLIDERVGPGEFLGRTKADAPDIDNCVHVSGPEGCLELGLVPVKITGTDPYDLYGDVIVT
ncbi:MAG: MiaB/RimO family radical SAM methylthiotransferase, partial [Lentisphaerae bacterium]|nr:MiaB/RimO family radical SAM methylthiotransferase [Lentisphaerota bacterium]